MGEIITYSGDTLSGTECNESIEYCLVLEFLQYQRYRNGKSEPDSQTEKLTSDS